MVNGLSVYPRSQDLVPLTHADSPCTVSAQCRPGTGAPKWNIGDWDAGGWQEREESCEWGLAELQLGGSVGTDGLGAWDPPFGKFERSCDLSSGPHSPTRVCSHAPTQLEFGQTPLATLLVLEMPSSFDPSPITRREALRTLAALTALTALPTRPQRIGIQLYTVRSLMPSAPERTLEALAAIGYREVELAGLYGLGAAQMKGMLERAGLRAVSAHRSIEDLRDQWPTVADDAHALGLTYVVCPWVNSGDRTLDGYHRLARDFNAIGKRAREAGLRFAYHDGDYAHARSDDGEVPYDILLAETDPSLVEFEIDLYWMITGGADPLAYFARWPGRFPMLHVKDRASDGAMTDAGAGTIDLRTILARGDAAGVRHWLVEHDEPKDPLASARASYAYLSRLAI